MSYFYICFDGSDSNGKTKRKLELKDANIGAMTVKELKYKLSLMQADLPKKYDLIFFGRQLKPDQNLLSNYGIKTGANIFVLSNSIDQDSDELVNSKPKFERAELQKMMVTIRQALINEGFRKMIARLYEKEFRDNVVMCTPGLKNHLVAFTILQDPDLMKMMCTDPENFEKIAQDYGIFAEAAHQLATAFHEELIATNTPTFTSALSTFNRNAYYYEHLSDLEDVDGTAENQQVQQVQEALPVSQNLITVNQLQAAIQAANQSARQLNLLTSREPSNCPPEQQHQSIPENQSQTTAELLNSWPQTEAMSVQQPQFTSEQQSNSNQLTTLTQATDQSQSNRDWTQHLNTMRSWGFQNDAISIQALEATNGQIEEAINWYLILNGQDNQ